MKKLSYLTNFLADKSVASVISSSTYTSRRICRMIDFEKAEVIVEYGPGTGILSKAFLRKMKAHTRLILVETNSYFVEALREMQDQQIEVVQDDALNIDHILKQRGDMKADYIISGVPLSFLSEEERNRLVKTSYDVLQPDGKLIMYQFSRTATDYLQHYFNDVKSEFEFLNIPPLTIYEARK